MDKVWIVWWTNYQHNDQLFTICTTEDLANECIKNQTLDENLVNFSIEEYELYG